MGEVIAKGMDMGDKASDRAHDEMENENDRANSVEVEKLRQTGSTDRQKTGQTNLLEQLAKMDEYLSKQQKDRFGHDDQAAKDAFMRDEQVRQRGHTWDQEAAEAAWQHRLSELDKTFQQQQGGADAQVGRVKDLAQFQHDLAASDYQSMGLPGGLASSGGGIRMPGGMVQHMSGGSTYRSSLAGDPRTTNFTGSAMQQANGWGDVSQI